MTKDRTVLVRVKRMGDIWATCGIGIEAPEHLADKPNIYDLCTKLVPGQCVRLPETHTLARHHLTEIVRRPQRDEFERPWVFKTAAHAAMADPSKSSLTADDIMNGLAMLDGARQHQEEKAEERFRDHDPEKREDGFYAEEDERDDLDDDLDDENERRSGNRELPSIRDDARPRSLKQDMDDAERDDIEEDAEPAPVKRRRSSRAR